MLTKSDVLMCLFEKISHFGEEKCEIGETWHELGTAWHGVGIAELTAVQDGHGSRK